MQKTHSTFYFFLSWSPLLWSARSRQTDGMFTFPWVWFLSHCVYSFYGLGTCFISVFYMEEAAVFHAGCRAETTEEEHFILVIYALLLIVSVSIKSGIVNLVVFSCLSIYSSSFFLVLLRFCVHTFESEQVLAIIISDTTMKISTADRDACTHTPQVCHISSVYWLWAQELWRWHWSV